MPASIPNRLDALSATAHDLVTAVNELNQSTDKRVSGVNKRLNRNRKVMFLMVVSFIVDIVLTGTVAWLLHSNNTTTHDVKQITQRLDYNSEVQRRKVLCPLYQLFEDSKSPEARKRNPQGPEAYDKAFKVIDEGYQALNCGAPLPNEPVTPVKPQN